MGSRSALRTLPVIYERGGGNMVALGGGLFWGGFEQGVRERHERRHLCRRGKLSGFERISGKLFAFCSHLWARRTCPALRFWDPQRRSGAVRRVEAAAPDGGSGPAVRGHRSRETQRGRAEPYATTPSLQQRKGGIGDPRWMFRLCFLARADSDTRCSRSLFGRGSESLVLNLFS